MKVKEQHIINELDSIIAYADGLKLKAAGLRRKLERLYDPASPKRGRKQIISDEVVAHVLAKRQKNRSKYFRKIEEHITD